MDTLEQFYDQTLDQVFRYVLLRVRNRQIAEDIVSEAYLKVAEHYNDFVPQAHASRRSWLFAIVRNTLTDSYRAKNSTNVELSADVPDVSTRNIDHGMDIAQDYGAALKKIDALPERQREIMLLRYKGELRNKEIAELLSIDERTVSATLSKAILALRTELRND